MIGLGQDGLGSLRSTFKNVRIPRHGFRHGAIVYAALTALICAAIASISSYESEMTVSRINSTANTRIQLPIDEGSCRVIRQDFYERNAFNRIVLKADIDPDDAGSCSTYAVTLEDSRRKTLYSAIIDEGCIVDGVVELSMDEIQSDSHYRLSLEKQGDRAPIRFYTRYSLLLDQYRGSLSTDLTDVFPSDLVMDVEYRYTGPYLKPNERLALALLLAAAAGFNLLYLSKKVSPASVHPRAEAGTLP